MGEAKGGPKAGDDGGDRHQKQGDGERPAIQRDAAVLREALQPIGGQGDDAEVGEEDAEGAAGDGQDQALEEEGVGHAQARRAESAADRRFARARDAAYQEQGGDVGAGDHQQQADGGAEHQDGGPRPFGYCGGQADGARLPAVVGVWVELAELGGEARQLAGRLCHVGAGARRPTEPR